MRTALIAAIGLAGATHAQAEGSLSAGGSPLAALELAIGRRLDR